MTLTPELSRTLNALGMLAVCVVLVPAYAYQFALYELPCPLCLLHIVPGTGHYGPPVMGLHFYTWAGICFFLIIAGTSIMLLSQGQYRSEDDPANNVRFGRTGLAKFAFLLMLALAIANVISTLLECGPGICADPPTDYKLIDDVTDKG